MSSRRTNIKLAALLLPAVLMLGAVRLFASDLRALGVKLTAPANLAEAKGEHTYVVPPGWRHREQLQIWTEDFLVSLAVDHGDEFGFSRKDLRPLTIVVHTDANRRKDDEVNPAPVDAASRRSWFVPASGRIIIDATDNPDLGEIRRNLSHQLVHAVLHYQRRPSQWPGWLVEGMAQVFETTELGMRRVNPRVVRQLSPQLPPGTLEAILKPDKLSAPYEASYALVLYLMYGPHREAFLAWFREELKSEKGTGLPDRILGTPKFEEEWLAWCRAPKLDR